MNNSPGKTLILLFVSFFLFGCVTQTVWVADPKIQRVQNPSYSVEFEPLREEADFFEFFRLIVTNKTGMDLHIDWNKTQYIRNGIAHDIFVFKGIDPDDIREKTIPHDIVPAGGTFTKKITPYKLLARAPVRSRSSDAGRIEAGLIPVGRNGIRLVMVQNGNEIIETLYLTIDEQAVQ